MTIVRTNRGEYQATKTIASGVTISSYGYTPVQAIMNLLTLIF